MATIYRFIVEERQTEKSSRKSGKEGSGTSKKTTAKKGKWVSVLDSPKGGVEANRKMRAINPLLNKSTGGYWEKGMRLGRAGLGLVQRNTETGEHGLSGPAVTIIIAFVIQSILKIQARDRARASEMNAQNYKMLENGVGSVHGEYNISVNMWNGRHTYNQNK